MVVRVAMVSKFYPSVGGTETHVRELSARLVSHGLGVKVFTSVLRESKTYFVDGLEVVNLPVLFPLNGYYYVTRRVRELTREIADYNPSLIHAHLFSFTMEFILPMTRKTLGVPLIITPHVSIGKGVIGGLVGGLSLRIVKTFFKDTDAVVAVSPKLANELEVQGVKNLWMIPNGVDTEKFKPGKSYFKEEIGADKIVLFVGRISSEKNIPTLIKAYKILSKSVENVKLVVVGKGPLLNKYMRVFSSENIVFTGYVDEKKLLDIYRGADVFVFPSLAEAQGIVCLEAMACAVPVVATNIGGVPFNLKWGGGRTVNPLDPYDIALNVLEYLRDIDLARQDGLKARQVVVKRFSWETVTNKILKLYESLI